MTAIDPERTLGLLPAFDHRYRPMSATRRQILIGALLITSAMLIGSTVLLVFEPAMGFKSFADFFVLQKVTPALSSWTWRIGNIAHILDGFGLILLCSGIRASKFRLSATISSFGLAAAPLFVVVGMSGFVGDQLLTLLADAGERDAALLGLIIGSRTMVLYAAVALFGAMVLAISADSHFVPRWLRILGVPVGVSGLLFVFLPTPVPAIFLVWSAAFLITICRTQSG